jgi:DNA-directed RNA polymerase I, II, and III subunit RPABC2
MPESSVKPFESFSSVMGSYNPGNNLTSLVMTKYEKAKLIGVRLEQIARGMEPTIDTKGMNNIRDIVIKELHEKTIPFIIERVMPNGKKEFWRVKDMIIPRD